MCLDFKQFQGASSRQNDSLPRFGKRDKTAMLRAQALQAIQIAPVEEKLQAVEAMAADAPVDPAAVLSPERPVPGREVRPVLVPPSKLEKRSMHTVEGRAIMMHAIAHIEFNAVDLALDIVWRFADMPSDFYRDWVRIAQEEVSHFRLIHAHLETLGYRYGDFPAHNGLWEMAAKTTDDVLARLALVPCTLEARGLDVNVPIRNKLAQAGDEAAAAILDVILRDEIGHVAAGNRWYKYLCTLRGIAPIPVYAELAARYQAPRLRGPFNLAARQAAGFETEELIALGVL